MIETGITVSNEFGKRLESIFGIQMIKSATLRFAVNELVVASVDHYVDNEVVSSVLQLCDDSGKFVRIGPGEE